MTTLIAAGDSFTWGNDLPDCNQLTASKIGWAAITAKQLGYDYKCVAVPGGSNQTVERNVIGAVEKIPDCFVVAMWTYPHRLEVNLRRQLLNKFLILQDYHTVSQWHGTEFEEKMKAMGIVDGGEKEFFLRQHEELVGNGIVDVSQILTKYMSDDYYYLATLRSQVMLKYYLESKKIPYLFLAATDNVILNRIKSDDPYVNTLKQISMSANWTTEPTRGFVEWATINDYKTGKTNHPMEAACKDYAEKFVIPVIKPIMNGGS
jgi:hypothetical protein